jgi:hypothetical protein
LRDRALHLGDGDFAFGHEHLDGGGGQADVERGAHRAHGNASGGDGERSRGIGCDGEVRLAGGEVHAALVRGEGDAEPRVGVELEDGAVGQNDAFVAAGGGGENLVGRGIWRRKPAGADEREREAGGEADGDAKRGDDAPVGRGGSARRAKWRGELDDRQQLRADERHFFQQRTGGF